ncbi:MAG: hypothetical protein AB7F59_11100 [Bdellovibrionales bacterium]
MNKRRNLFFVFLVTLSFSVPNFLLTPASAQLAIDEAPLDPPYPKPPSSRSKRAFHRAESTFQLPLQSDTLGMIKKQSPVKSQESRGSCSIFSATALIESLVITHRSMSSVDYSEEWLQYVIASISLSDGSTSPRNFSALRQYGTASETFMPYIGTNWESFSSDILAEKRCKNTTGIYRGACFVGHRNPALLSKLDAELSKPKSPFYDPEFVTARKDAYEFRDAQAAALVPQTYIYSTQVKQLLAQGQPVLLDLDFYYGAWNHRMADSLGIGRDLTLWAEGAVTYPEYDSLDRTASQRDPAGHSILLVGYDDTREVTYSYLARDGKTKVTKTRKGVFYFKNSWGTAKFGVNFQLDGTSYPGYGFILQDYANDLGTYHTITVTPAQ